MEIVKKAQKILPVSKMKKKGLPLLCCGAAKIHSVDSYAFLNIKTQNFVESRNINLWMNQTYRKHNELAPSAAVDVALKNDTFFAGRCRAKG